jgi:transcriptional regulator with XRE-family HTH domain
MATIQIMEFNEWIEKKYMEWCGQKRRTIIEFADYLGVKQPALSKWMKPGSTRKPDRESVRKIAEKYPDIYAALDMSPPPSVKLSIDLNDPEFIARASDAGKRLEEELTKKGIDLDSPEGIKIAIEILFDSGFTHISTEREDS